MSIRMKDRGTAGVSLRDLHSSVYPVTLEDSGFSHAMSTDVSDWGRTLTLDTESSPKPDKNKSANIIERTSVRNIV